MSSSGNLGVCKSTRVRFTYNDDLAFLKEFLSHNPTQNIDGWEVIQRNMELITRKKFSIRTLKHHLQLLIEIWLKKDEGDKKRSGIEELHSEKDMLLQEVSSLCAEYNFTSKRKKTISKEQHLSELGKEARHKYASIFAKKPDETEIIAESASPVYELLDHNYVNHEEMSLNILEEVEVCNDEDREMAVLSEMNTNNRPDIRSTSTSCLLSNISSHKRTRENEVSSPQSLPNNGNVLGPARRRLKKRDPIRKNALSYLSEKNERENELKKKELELEERKLAIEERRLNLAEKKCELEKQRLELETKERLQRIELEREKSQVELHERKINFNLLQSQQKLIDTILTRDGN